MHSRAPVVTQAFAVRYQNLPSRLKLNLVERYLLTISPDLLFCFSTFCFFFICLNFFVFVNMEPYGRKNVKRHLLLKLPHNTDSLQKIHATSREGLYQKLYKDCRNFKFWIFDNFFFRFMGEKTSTTSYLKVHNTFAPKTSCILLESVSTKVERIVKFQILDFWQTFLFLFFLFFFWGGAFNMVVNGEL